MKYLKRFFESESLYTELMDIVNLASDVDPSDYRVNIFPDVEYFNKSGKCHLEIRRTINDNSEEFYDLISSVYDRLQYSRFEYNAKIEYFHGSPNKPEPGPSGGIFPMVENIHDDKELQMFLTDENIYVVSIEIRIYENGTRTDWTNNHIKKNISKD